MSQLLQRASWFPPRQTTRGSVPTCATTRCMRMLSLRARGTWRSTTRAPGKRTGAKVMAMRAKRFRVEMTFLKRLRQREPKVARLVKIAAVPSLISGSDVTGMPLAQLNEARLIARKICSEKTYHCCLEVDLLLEDAGRHRGRRASTSAILMWQCAWVERWVPALWMTLTLLAASERLRDCVNPWKLVNGPASAVVASMMRSLGRTKGVLSFASVGHGALHAVLQDAHDRRTWERACNPALVLVGGPPLVAPLRLAQHLRTSGEHLARGALQSVFLGTMRTQNLEWLERISRLWARCGTDVASAPHLQNSDAAHCQNFDLDTWLDRMPLSGVAGIFWTRLMLRPGHPQAHQARARRLGGASRER